MSTCIFSEIVARDAHAVAFLDVEPLADGHVLVVPTAHVNLVEEMPPDAAAGLFQMVARIAGEVRLAVGAAGSTIGINNGQATGQTVPHVHIHIVPRWPGDDAGSIHSMFHRRTSMSLAEVAQAMRDVLGG